MSRILISGLINTETTVRVRQFPVLYYPIDYPFFGVNTAVSGVAYNIARAIGTLGDQITLLSMTGADFPGAYIRQELLSAGIDPSYVKSGLKETPSSVVLYDGEGKRQIYCDLKDIQEASYAFSREICADADIVVACNTNFNRALLPLAKEAGIPIATDVHVLTQVYDGYNRDFMQYADLLFLSDEGIGENYRAFLADLEQVYGTGIIVLGRGNKGAAMYLKDENRLYELPAARVGQVVNTVGAGDALFSAFVHEYAGGRPPLESLIRAELFASAKIGASGASKGFVTEQELDALYDRFAGELLRECRVLPI